MLPAISEMVFKSRTVVLLAGFVFAVATVMLAFKAKHEAGDFALVTSVFLVCALLLVSCTVLATTAAAVKFGIYGQPALLNSK